MENVVVKDELLFMIILKWYVNSNRSYRHVEIGNQTRFLRDIEVSMRQLHG